ncbi:MAG: GAF domain-containing protein [Proteobacteria bacterium]|nr:GAF domain-containing protein [Pseudomonadota bacterium]MBU1714927.1 GAF domain-containing protein [Pseudomonadota bacterium]
MNEIKKIKPAAVFTDLNMANRLLECIARISSTISVKKLSFQRRLDIILQVILDYLGADHGSIMILENKKKLVVKAASKSELIGKEQLLSSNSIASWVAQSGKPLFVPDITKDKRFKGRGKGYKKKSLLSVPIMSENKVAGVINVTDKTGSKDLLNDDIAYLLDFSSLLLWAVMQENLHTELKKQRNTLKKRNQELRCQEKLKANLSSSLIHDLKGPLSEVVANLDILSYSIADDNKEFLESAQLGCDRAVSMVSNLVSIDKIEDGKLKLLREEIKPEDLLQESIISIQGLAKIKDVKLIIDPLGFLPPLSLDRILIFRVLQNLLTNALSYAPNGSTIHVGCQQPAKNTHLEFYVIDQGEGIAPDSQQIIFKKYARISKKNDNLTGTGLGLFFCKLAVNEHGGEIGVESIPGQGSRFYFSIPLTLVKQRNI